MPILMRILKMSFVAAFAAAVVFYGASATPAYAYLDPGTGSMILQVLLGGAAGLALAGRLYRHRFLTVIGVRADADDTSRSAATNVPPRADT
jgi:hypothetical protein